MTDFLYLFLLQTENRSCLRLAYLLPMGIWNYYKHSGISAYKVCTKYRAIGCNNQFAQTPPKGAWYQSIAPKYYNLLFAATYFPAHLEKKKRLSTLKTRKAHNVFST